MSSRDAAKKRAGSTTDDATEGRSGRRNRRVRLAGLRPARRAPRPHQAADGRLRRRHRGERAARRGARRLRRDPDRARPRRTAPSPSCCSSTAPARSSSDDRLEDLVERIATADGAGRRVGRPVGQPGHRRGHRPAGGRPHRRRVRRAAGWRSPRPCSATARLDGEAAVGDKVSAGEAVDLGLVDNAAPTIGVFVYGQPPDFEGLPGVETHGRRRAAPARHPDALRPAPAVRPARSTPWPARRWPTSSS